MNLSQNFLGIYYLLLILKCLQNSYKKCKISTDKILKNLLPKFFIESHNILQFYFKICNDKFENYFKKSYKILTYLLRSCIDLLKEFIQNSFLLRTKSLLSSYDLAKIF